MNFAVVNCSELVTLSGPARRVCTRKCRELGVVRDGVMIVRDGVINVRRTALARLISQCRNHPMQGTEWSLPGFVDAHTHPVFAGNQRGRV